MRVAVLSDIHGNLIAMRKVLDDLQHEAEKIVCLGDSAWGPQPSEVLRELRRLNCPVVMGNTDEHLIGRLRENLKGPSKEIDSWCVEQLSGEDRHFIQGFSPIVSVNLGDGLKLLCYHGSPRSNREGIYSTTTEGKLATIFSGHTETIAAGGHTHTQMVRRFRKKLIINPGSVGLPIEMDGKKPRHPSWAEYAILEYSNAKLSLSLRRAEYDVSELEEVVIKSGMPHGAWWMKDWKRL